ncbi:UNVERIFIED_CONTAM: hypothetical protein GTU68_042857, partial [Idotea baltica]|nr:hypothetical protein [Idotea baltica]
RVTEGTDLFIRKLPIQALCTGKSPKDFKTVSAFQSSAVMALQEASEATWLSFRRHQLCVAIHAKRRYHHAPRTFSCQTYRGRTRLIQLLLPPPSSSFKGPFLGPNTNHRGDKYITIFCLFVFSVLKSF